MSEVALGSVEFMTGWVLHWFTAVRARLRRRGDLLLEHIVLRHQLVILQRTGTRRPRLHPSERLFWAFLSRRWADWRRSLIIVQPATVLRWRRRGLRAGWGSGSRGRWRGGRPRIDSEIRALIVRMGRENFLWGAPRIHGELLKLGFDVSQATVSRYMPRRSYPPSQSWRTFLQNQVLGMGTFRLPDAARISHQLVTLICCGWIYRMGRRAAKLWEAPSCLHPSRRSSHARDLTDRRAIHCGRILVRPPRTVRNGAHWMTVGVRTLPYRSRASPAPKLPAFMNLARCRASAGAIHFSLAKNYTAPPRQPASHT